MLTTKVDDQNRVDWLHFVDTFDPHKIGPPTTRLQLLTCLEKHEEEAAILSNLQKTMSMAILWICVGVYI